MGTFSTLAPDGKHALCLSEESSTIAKCIDLVYIYIFKYAPLFDATASVPASETESVNTENQNGEDEKTPCCGPLW